MTDLRFGAILKAALVAGLVSAIAVAALHSVLTEPVIDQAIAIEESHSQSMGMPEEEPIVSREVQKGGLWLGLLVFGLTVGLLLGGVFYVVQGWLPTSSLWARGLVLCAFAYWALALLPFLKYPANPPAVGDPETIGLRQSLYVGILVLGLVGAVLATWLMRARGVAIGIVALGVYSLIVFLVLPNNPDAITIPEDLLMAFRVRSLLGLTAFWGLVAVIFGLTLNRQAKMT